jgi:hypothetical protein
MESAHRDEAEDGRNDWFSVSAEKSKEAMLAAQEAKLPTRW